MAAQYDFSEREQTILKLLVGHYLEEGTPVASRTLSRMPGVDISAASVRNVMGDLEDMGLLRSPHVSAGRVPTQAALRVFVDSMLEMSPPDDTTIMEIRNQLDPNLPEASLMKVVSNSLAGFTRLAGMVTVPRRDEKSVQQVEFLPLSDKRVLAILIINEREVQNRIIQVDREYDKEELAAFAGMINAEYLGQPLSVVRDRLLGELESTREHLDQRMQQMIELAGRAFAEDDHDDADDSTILTGEVNLLGHDDLNDIETLRGLFDVFRKKRDIYHLLERCLSAEGVQIFIGRESGYDGLGGCSLVAAPYRIDGKVLGVLGVIGPKRMSYGEVVPVVEVTSRLLGAALAPQQGT